MAARVRLLPTAAALAFALLLDGCTTGPVGPTPAVRHPREAADVTVFRDGTWEGLGAPVMLRIDGFDAFRVGRNEAYRFQLDPGEYIFDYTIGFNECRRVATIQPGGSYRFRLAPNCTRFDWGGLAP